MYNICKEKAYLYCVLLNVAHTGQRELLRLAALLKMPKIIRLRTGLISAHTLEPGALGVLAHDVHIHVRALHLRVLAMRAAVRHGVISARLDRQRQIKLPAKVRRETEHAGPRKVVALVELLYVAAVVHLHLGHPLKLRRASAELVTLPHNFVEHSTVSRHFDSSDVRHKVPIATIIWLDSSVQLALHSGHLAHSLLLPLRHHSATSRTLHLAGALHGLARARCAQSGNLIAAGACELASRSVVGA